MFAFTPDVQPSRSVDEDPRNLCEQAHNNARAMYQKAPIQSDYRVSYQIFLKICVLSSYYTIFKLFVSNSWNQLLKFTTKS